MNINDIPRSGLYEGYYWLSNANAPCVLRGTVLPEEFYTGPNPFVVEAQLYDAEHRMSYSVHHAGNVTVCSQHAVTDENTESQEVERVSFLASKRMAGVGRLCFIDCWEPEPDSLCLGMEVLKFKKRVFVGFDKDGY